MIRKEQLVIEQGYLMGKGGKMYVDLSGGVSVGDYGVIYGTAEIEIQ